MGLAEHAAKYPNQISGGQQQRVALARALALSPGLLLLDEPLSALDANVRAHLRDELKALQQRIGVTALMVTHDREEAFSVADQIVIMNKGRIEQTGSPEDIYRKPANLFVARLLGGCNAFRLEVAGESHAVAEGLQLATGPRPMFRNGSAYACIRPGAVLVGHEADGSENAFPARITALTFLGDIVRLQARPEQGAGAIIEAEVLRSRFDSLPSDGRKDHGRTPEAAPDVSGRHIRFMTSAVETRARPANGLRRPALTLLLPLSAVVLLALATVLPIGALLIRSLFDRQGNFIGLANFVRYASEPD